MRFQKESYPKSECHKDVDSRFFGRLGGRDDGAGVATPHHRVATPSRGNRHFSAVLFRTWFSFKHSMRPVASSLLRHASAQRRDPRDLHGAARRVEVYPRVSLS